MAWLDKRTRGRRRGVCGRGVASRGSPGRGLPGGDVQRGQWCAKPGEGGRVPEDGRRGGPALAGRLGEGRGVHAADRGLSPGQRKRYLGQIGVLARTRVRGSLLFSRPGALWVGDVDLRRGTVRV